MDKNKIKSFATWARRAMIQAVSDRAYKIGIEKNHIQKAEAIQGGFRLQGKEEIFNFQLSERNKLEALINEKGYEQVMEEVAYTWFNRFMGLRYMEVNDYLPMGIRVLSSEVEGKREPDALNRISEVIEELELKADEIYSLLDTGKNEDREKAYRKILVAQCNKLGEIIPQMFEKITDYTELLLPDNLLSEGSVIDKMVNDIDEEDWKEEVEIIGWMYQYYISEKKDEVFAALKKNIKITKENIPAATQLFTPKWIVKYMVENSLGRLWLEGHPNKELQEQFKYYLEEAEQEDEVEKELIKIREEHAKLNPEEIKVLDPCMGSGHILVYAFDVLYQIYLSAGYSEREIPRKILENNLYGLDIDDRAAQLAAFALIMKARHYNRRLFREIKDQNIDINICSFKESNILNNEELIKYFSNGIYEIEETFRYLIDNFIDAKEYGSLKCIDSLDFALIYKRMNEIIQDDNLLFEDYKITIINQLPTLIKQAEIINNKYEVCITNPPYMGTKGMNNKLATYLKSAFPISKYDLYSAFIERSLKWIKLDGKVGMISQQSWLFLSMYEKFREYILNNSTMMNLIHLGAKAFPEISGEVVQTAAFILSNRSNKEYRAKFINLAQDMNAEMKEVQFFNVANYYFNMKQEDFLCIPGYSVAYWLSPITMNIFKTQSSLNKWCEPKKGLVTSDNNRFLRLWTEVSFDKIGMGLKSGEDTIKYNKKWIPFNKGGSLRKWYGNNEYVINWENNGKEVIEYAAQLYGSASRQIQNVKFYFKEGLTWSGISSNIFAVRKTSEGFIFDTSGPSLFSDHNNYLLGLLNSNVFNELLKVFTQTLSVNPTDVGKVPVIFNIDKEKKEKIENIVMQNYNISKYDWDSYETSWDFKFHPFINITKQQNIQLLDEIYHEWEKSKIKMFNKLKENEEELNDIFIRIYGLENELSKYVEDKNITIFKADKEKDIKSLISYIVGCIFGRYSIDKKEDEKYPNNNQCTLKESSTKLSIENVIVLTETEYFEEDIIKEMCSYIKLIFGEEFMEHNLEYIANVIGRKAGETARQAIRRYFLKDFYKDHLKTYQKRPIYWLLDSGKENGFKALIYMHRYDESTIAKVRTDYLHVLQRKYETEVQRLQLALEAPSISAKDKVANTKKMDKLKKQIQECIEYDQVVKHVADKKISIDLDDGVKVNYAKFQDVKVINSAGKEVKMNLLAKI